MYFLTLGWIGKARWYKRGVGDWGSSKEDDRTSAHRPGGGRGNGTAAEDWRHQRKRLSFRAWNKDRTQTLPALFHFNPSTLATSLLTLNYYLRSAVWHFLPVRAQTRASCKGIYKSTFYSPSEHAFSMKWHSAAYKSEFYTFEFPHQFLKNFV